MKRIIFLAILTITGYVMQAQDIRGRRVIADQQLRLRGTRVDSLSQDTTNWGNALKTIPRAKHVYDFVANRTKYAGRFGVEDILAAQNRSFDLNSYSFSMTNASSLNLMHTNNFINFTNFGAAGDSFYIKTSVSNISDYLSFIGGKFKFGRISSGVNTRYFTIDADSGLFKMPLFYMSKIHASLNGHALVCRDLVDSLIAAAVISAGSGTVTTVGTTDGYGISSSVSNPTTTPNITIGIDSSTLSSYYLRRKDSTDGGYYPYSSNPKGYVSTNFANANLTLTGSRTHNANNNDLFITNANRFIIGITGTHALAGGFSSTTLTNGTLFELNVNGSDASGNSQTVFRAISQGTNTNAGQETFAAEIRNLKTGTGGINNALKLDASGGATNYALNITAGKFKLTDGTQTNGYVLTSDANGVASWAAPTGGGGSGTVNSGTANRLGYYASTGTTISELAAITANRTLISDANGLPTHSSVTNTELGYVSGVTSSIQTQLNAKVASVGTINSQTKSANGAVISGSSLVLQTADANNPGLMSAADKRRLDSNFTVIRPTVGVQIADTLSVDSLRIKSLIEGRDIDIINNGDTTITIKYQPSVDSTASGATITPNADNVSQYKVTALAANATIAAPTGTPTDGQFLLIRIKDNGTSRTLTWNSIYRAGTQFSLPSATTISKWMYVQFIYNATDNKWDAIGLTNGI